MSCKDLVVKPDENKCMYYITGGMCSKADRFRCEEYIAQKEPVLSYSGINSFMKCPRKYYWSSVRGLKTREDKLGDALKIGLTVDQFITTGKMCSKMSGSVAEAKILAMIDAYAALFDRDYIWKNYTGQREVTWEEDGYPKILCKIDMAQEDHFIELKCSGRPDFYANPYYIHDQLATYFLAEPKFQSCKMWVIRTPLLRLGKTETHDEFEQRCFDDMIARPGHYFNAYCSDTDPHTFGVTYYRSEFDLESIKKRAKKISRHIVEAVKEDYWYQDRTQCMLPGKCDYMSVCDTGGISEDLYEWRKKDATKTTN